MEVSKKNLMDKSIKSMNRGDLLNFLGFILNPALDDDLFNCVFDFFYSCKTSVLREFANYFRIFQNFHEVT